MSYFHWHKVGVPPGAHVQPAECCTDAIEAVWSRRVDDAENAERRRVILEAAAAIEAYGEGALSVLDAERRALVQTVIATAVTAIKRTGCICPDCDVSTFGEAPGTSFVKGRDGRCGMHEGAT